MYLPFVNIKMGTGSSMRYSCGNTLPLTQLPFAMASFCPQTERMIGQENWFYKPDAPFCEGIRLTHQPSPWIGDYGTFLMSVQNDVVSDTAEGACSSFRHKDTVLSPHYMRLHLLRPNAIFELTPTERGGTVRISCLDKRQSYLSFLPISGNYTYTLDKEKGILYGTSDGQARNTAKNFKMYFAVKFDKDSADLEGSYGTESYFHLALKNQNFECKLGISYISHQMAEEALARECGDKSFDAVKIEAERAWEEKLSRIEIETEDEEQKHIFYSCMYRCFLFPHKAHEIDKNGNIVHYCPCDGGLKDGVMYTDTGFWDTARTQFPLFALMARDEYAEMLEGFVNTYSDSGFLPRWPSLDEAGCMPSTLIDPVVLDAVYNKIGSYAVWKQALLGMIHHANQKGNEPRFGRRGIEEYKKLGYVPCDLYKESVNLTLDASYGDWCISELIKLLGTNDPYLEYLERSRNYRNIFDKKTGFMRGRTSSGEFEEGFDPTSWGGSYTEGSAYQSSHFVPHDIDGLCELYGGKDELIKKLDEIFDTPPTFRVFGYGGEIHEMSEMASVDFGQCAISNQPSFHIPYLYAYLGKPEKTHYWVSRMCAELFTRDSYPGDEDNGSMSAWYILSTLGMYPLCAGKEMIKTKPLVKSAKIMNKKIF